MIRPLHRMLPVAAGALTLMLLLASCTVRPVTSTLPTANATLKAQAPAGQTGAQTAGQPPAVEYDLGEATIVQERFPADSRFRKMPVRLNGLIAVPDTSGPHPVVVILHGTHPGCPVLGHVDVWPCAPEDERPNYRGFDYLVSKLAANGYVALSVNINAENTFGFGEPTPFERLHQVLDLHLTALAEAASGGANQFGVDLKGKADVHRLALIGHSRGGEAAFVLANDPKLPTGAPGKAYGPVAGVLMVAPAIVTFDPAGGSHVPFATILPACDADITDQDGQHFYEGARLAPKQREWATSVWLDDANHNAFNTILGRDPFGLDGRPDCATLLAPDAQRAFLGDYAIDFLTTIFSPNPAAVRAAMQRMGLDPAAPAPNELYGQSGRIMSLPTKRDRLPLLVPANGGAFKTSPVDGSVKAEGLTTFFCPEGYYTPFSNPELSACHRANVVVPGQPAHAVVAWEKPGGSLRFSLPAGLNNLLFFDAVTLRAAVDPLSPLNVTGQSQSFSVRLTDVDGQSATVQTRPDEPALAFPQGEEREDESFGTLFTGRVPLTAVRVPLSEFKGVNLAMIKEVALVFDQTDQGALFVADLELARSPIGQQETLDAPPSPELIAAAEAGDVEAMRQLANLYRPTESLGVRYGNLDKALMWYRAACKANYANAQVDFYNFARTHAETTGDQAVLSEALVCLDKAVEQGHRDAISARAFHAAFIEQDYARGFYLYALLEDAAPEIAAQRHSFAGKLTQAEIDQAEQDAKAWRAANQVKTYDDFFAEVNSPFRQVPTPKP